VTCGLCFNPSAAIEYYDEVGRCQGCGEHMSYFVNPDRDPSWANLVRSGSGLDGFDDPRDMVG